MVTPFHQSRRNVMIVRDDPGRGFGRKVRIDVWGGGLQANGSLMMLFADLLSRNVQWSQATVHIKLFVPTAEAADSARANLQFIIGGLRIGATPHALVANGRHFAQTLRDWSSDADQCSWAWPHPMRTSSPATAECIHWCLGSRAPFSYSPARS